MLHRVGTLMRHSIACGILWVLLSGAGHAALAADAEIIVSGLGFPEGTIFVGPTLYFVDYAKSDVLRLNNGKAERVWHLDGCGANGLAQLGQTLVVACYSNNSVVKIALDGKTLQTIAADEAGNPFNRPNDLATDAKGGVYFTGSGDSDFPGKVYYLTPDGRAKKVADDIRNANGVAVSPDGRILYVGESNTDSLLTYTIAPDGGLSDRKLFLDLARILSNGKGRATPDGVRLDQRGRLFISLYNGGGFAVFAPDGKLITKIDLPGPHHANLAISPDGRFVYGTIAYDLPGGSYNGALYRVPNPVWE
jgi:sugar lactone lactonase YvrE